jgi:small multidrug resistance pump
MNPKIIKIVKLQGIVFIYSIVSVLSKVASQFLNTEGIFSFHFFLTVGLMLLALGIYAILWQRVLKGMELSVAYLNKGMQLFWSILWSVIIFREAISIQNIFGVILIIIGIWVVNK